MRYRLFNALLAGCLLLPLFASELDDLLLSAEKNSPTITAQQARLEQFRQKHRELDEFFDPNIFAAGGRDDSFHDLPTDTGYTDLTENSYDLQAGAEVPIQPGAYVAAGAALRRLTDSDDYHRLYQTLYGIRLRIPLLNDRGFKQLDLSRALAMAEYNEAAAALLATSQKLHHDVEAAYITVYEKYCAWQNAIEASRRFANHLKETQELCRLAVVPQYQLFQSQMELQNGLDDEEKARCTYEISLLELKRITALEQLPALSMKNDLLIQKAMQKIELAAPEAQQALEARGSWQQKNNVVRQAEIRQETAKEEMRDKLDLQFGIAAQGEHPSEILHQDDLETDKTVGGEIMLVWKRRFDYRGPKARLARYKAQAMEYKAQLREQSIIIEAEVRTARTRLAAAQKRFDIVNKGIDAAKQYLEAEQERFRQGEATSTNVTDAQKNLTNTLLRQITAAADLLRAKAEYLYAIGYWSPSQKAAK